MIAQPRRFVALAGLVLAALAPLAAQGPRSSLLSALLVVPAVAGPVWVTLAYLAAVRKAHALALLDRPVWWSWAVANPLPLMVAALGPAALAAWSVGALLVTRGWWGWGALAAMAALLYAAAALLAPRLGAFRPYARLRPVLRRAPLLAAGSATLAWAAALGLSGTEGTLAERVAAQPRYEGSSALLALAVDAWAVLTGARGWGEAWMEGQGAGLVVAAWRLLAAFAQALLVAGVFAAGLLPPGEAGRILRPTDADRPAPAGAWRLGLAAAIATGAALLTLGLAAALEAWAGARARPLVVVEAPALAPGEAPEGRPVPPASPGAPRPGAAPSLPAPSALRARIESERWADLLCPPGTIAEVAALDGRLGDALAAQRAEVEAAARAGFEAMRANVPAYLDWHYSLSAEYARTGHLLIGDGEEFLRGRFEERLGTGAPMARLEAAVAATAANAGLLAEHERARAALLGGCGPPLPDDRAEVVVTATAPPEVVAAAPRVELMAFEARLGASALAGAAGAVGGAVLGQAVAKIAVTAGFKAVAAALAKAAAAKAAGGLGGMLLGAAAGGAGGSVVPVIGTGVGAVLGGIVGGLALGVGVDAALVEVEEAIGREAFAAEILGAIDAAEAELLAALGAD